MELTLALISFSVKTGATERPSWGSARCFGTCLVYRVCYHYFMTLRLGMVVKDYNPRHFRTAVQGHPFLYINLEANFETLSQNKKCIILVQCGSIDLASQHSEDGGRKQG